MNRIRLARFVIALALAFFMAGPSLADAGSRAQVGSTLDRPGVAVNAGLFSLNTSSVPALSGQSGSVTLAHDGPYGSLSGKAVAVEPATGFTFDTALQPVPVR